MGEKREHYNNYIQHFLPTLKEEITKSKELNLTKRTEIEKIIMKLRISDNISKISNKDSKIEKQPINSIKEEIPDILALIPHIIKIQVSATQMTGKGALG